MRRIRIVQDLVLQETSRQAATSWNVAYSLTCKNP